GYQPLMRGFALAGVWLVACGGGGDVHSTNDRDGGSFVREPATPSPATPAEAGAPSSLFTTSVDAGAQTPTPDGPRPPPGTAPSVPIEAAAATAAFHVLEPLANEIVDPDGDPAWTSHFVQLFTGGKQGLFGVSSVLVMD